MNKGCRTSVLIGVLVSFIFGMGLLAILIFVSYGDGGAWRFGGAGESVALLEVEGPIFDGEETLTQLKEYIENPAAKAIVVRVNSPGGAVAPSQEIYEGLKRAKAQGKKVVVSMGSVAASGGYYIACAADEIYANPGTITGSIGVIAEFPNIQGLMEKIGIKFDIIKTGQFKDTGSVFRSMTPEEEDLIQKMLMDVYDQFVEAVAEGRNMPVEQVRQYADGRVFSGRQALEYGFVDALGTQYDAVMRAASLAGIEGEPQIIRKHKRRFPFGEFVENMLQLYLPASQGMRPPVQYLFR
ncbi:MAG: signal peptide peptidase SppA [Candidatus Abyssobacteria bacterium SURF_5]|uniref:Signal peptide peptidase SppA n=1 Tax=Abyssobacteria bacterium (strain SURF_5) TaxID=2093360 RepID=A0A3A4NXC3_ABYX5|nr:MAG: signal peptide peptidase SppA [Candidatus Abyssubacteria bacterium SURF_5]